MVLEKQIKLLGEDHPQILEVMNSLGMTYTDFSQFQEAEELKLAVVEKYRRLLGEDHLNTLVAMNNLVSLYHTLG